MQRRKRRRRNGTTSSRCRSPQGFECSLAPGLLQLELESQDFLNANACLRGWSTTLRAADALHLAIASGRGATLCSLDAPFVEAARRLGLDAQWLAPSLQLVE